MLSSLLYIQLGGTQRALSRRGSPIKKKERYKTSTRKKSLDDLSVSDKRLKELENRSDKSIDYSDIPELDADFWQTAEIHEPANKERLTVRFDAEMVAWFKQQGRGYQTRMNAVLKSFYEAHRHD